MKIWPVVIEFIDYKPEDKNLALDEELIRELIGTHLGPELPETIGFKIKGIAQPYQVKGAGR